ncbi:response regulator transcription factor [Flavobacterium terrigena]|uniref:DNA-binding response regulator, NarL/FixJ family, contains REC and HTH domains n=1 Tax=Flavobacterium terrigena TaxID=402734 RepID=A0A1H6S5T0_9FLAO|nr:response regulator transcription factor [Flavobacterium terrigena]SEI63413.1 DNA-binding response regulator, NarL/FixJ family, contains REC and HTH domains [Flavobacterium terrigena]
MIKVALVDDHQLFRKSLSMLLSSFEGVDVIYDTNDGLAFLKYAESEVIDVLLLDIQMPILDGFEVCKRLKLINPDVKILIISQLTSREAIHQIMECGANGFFTKNSSPELLESAMRKVMERDYYFDVELGAVIREAILWDKKVHYNTDLTVLVTLTSRELEIIRMACKELSSKEIGDKLCISTRTVEKHRKRIMEKTNSKNFIGVVLYALKTNAISLSNI